jgi:hypothetical protein
VDIPVTSQPLGLFPGGYNGALTLFNNDTAKTVYVGETGPTCQQGQGLPLPPRASTQWDSGRPLWLTAPAGTASSPVIVSVVSNQGTVFSPADIAAQIIAQGLTPLAIANAIVASALATNTGTQTATQIALSGAPPIDLPATLANTSQGVASGATPANVGPLNVAAYSSVEVEITETGATANTGYRRLALTWYADAATSVVITTQYYYYDAFNGIQGIRVPCPRGAVRLTLSWTSAVTTTSVTQNILVLASMFAVPPTSFNQGGNTALYNNQDWNGISGLFVVTSGANVASRTWRPCVYEGQAYLGALVLGATGANRLGLIDAVTGTDITDILIPTTTTVAPPTPVILPRRPVNINWVNSGTVTGLQIFLSMTPW